MEDKRKTLRDLEARKIETLGLLDNLLEKLGESLASRLEIALPPLEAGSPSFFLNEKNRLTEEISDSAMGIKTIEDALRHLGDLDEEISRKQREKNELVKETSLVYTDVGRRVLNESEFETFAFTYRQEKNDITGKIDFQQRRLEELDNPGEGFFKRMANSVQSLVVKSMLSKNEAALEKLFRVSGEQFLAAAEDPLARGMSVASFDIRDNETADLVESGLALRTSLNGLNDEITALKNERKETAAALDEKGNPGRRISELEQAISNNKEEIRKVHRNIGACIRGEWESSLVGLYSDADAILDDKIRSLYDSLEDTERKIKTVKIAIAIDTERNEIAKLKRQAADKRQHIVETEAAIAGLETQIGDAEKRIDTLQDELGLIHGEDN